MVKQLALPDIEARAEIADLAFRKFRATQTEQDMMLPISLNPKVCCGNGWMNCVPSWIATCRMSTGSSRRPGGVRFVANQSPPLSLVGRILWDYARWRL